MTALNKVVVVGGGIGGLVTTLALLKQGMDVDVYEQSTQLGEVGAGIQISPNGTRVLLALGLEEALRRIAVSPLRKEIRHWRTGKTWNWYNLGAASDQRYGAPHVLLHRGDLHAMLVDAVRRLKPDAIHLGKRCVDIIRVDGYVDVQFARAKPHEPLTSSERTAFIRKFGSVCSAQAVLSSPAASPGAPSFPCSACRPAQRQWSRRTGSDLAATCCTIPFAAASY